METSCPRRQTSRVSSRLLRGRSPLLLCSNRREQGLTRYLRVGRLVAVTLYEARDVIQNLFLSLRAWLHETLLPGARVMRLGGKRKREVNIKVCEAERQEK